jgi:predicted dehydrogenase
VVIDLATHDLDVMYNLAGSEVQRLYAETEQRIHTDHEDILNALLKFESGVIGVLQVNWLTPTKIRELSVLGERGMFVCNYLTQELTHFKNADVSAMSEAGPHLRAVSEGEAVSFPITQAEPLKLELQSFLQAVRGEHLVEVDGEAGLRALHLALALVTSASESRVISRTELDGLWSRASPGVARRASRAANRDDR